MGVLSLRLKVLIKAFIVPPRGNIQCEAPSAMAHQIVWLIWGSLDIKEEVISDPILHYCY